MLTEQPIRMPNDYVCYHTAVRPKIKRKNVPVTYMAAHNSCKINNRTLALWSRILQSQPYARLLMAYKGLQANERRIKETLGVDNEIIIYDHIPHEQMMELYNEADVTLDTWPYSGGLVVCESLYMGVPVVTLPSQMFSGRHAASHLKNVGLSDYIATDERDYIDKAIALGSPINDFVRKQIRDMMEMSPLMQYDQFAHDWNAAMWRVFK